MFGVEVTDIRDLNSLGYEFWENEEKMTLLIVQNDLIICQFKLDPFGRVVCQALDHFCVADSFFIKEAFGNIFIGISDFLD